MASTAFAVNRLIRNSRPGIVAILVTLAMLGMMGIATAKTGEEGVAVIYSDKFQGKKTTNVGNGKSVVVTVNDRMASSKRAVIDVSRHAAEERGFAKAGKAKVKLEVEK